MRSWCCLPSSGPSKFPPEAPVPTLYLVVFGSIVGYSCYIYSLAHLSVSIVTVYNYLNPLVAVILGWMVYREPFGVREATAMGTIFLGVAIVKRLAMPRQNAAPPVVSEESG